MMRQYGAHRRMGGHNPLGVGVIAVGSIFYLQDHAFFSNRFGGQAVRYASGADTLTALLVLWCT